jgi:hypothetical protein
MGTSRLFNNCKADGTYHKLLEGLFEKFIIHTHASRMFDR